jgi:hypothetical protein
MKNIFYKENFIIRLTSREVHHYDYQYFLLNIYHILNHTILNLKDEFFHSFNLQFIYDFFVM